jgi:hypothetical protein
LFASSSGTGWTGKISKSTWWIKISTKIHNMRKRRITMNIQKIVRLKFFAGRLLFLITALLLVAGLVFIQEPEAAFAMPFNPPDGKDDQIGGNPPPFRPPADGFNWSVPARYGLNESDDGLMDTYWRAASFDYDPAYIYPDTWSMQFFGCQTGPDAEVGASTTNTYEWNIDGNIVNDGRCFFTYDGFTQQGTYPVTLTYTPQNGTAVSFTQQVYIKDYFLIAIGDSLASGEGNPDIPQPLGYDSIIGYFPTGPATWQDKRCHRSAYAYPSKAAIELEYSDPHTSVTFISFACSGATINTPAWDPKYLEWMPPFVSLEPDVNKARGTGLLGPYIGNETDDYRQETFIPSQMDQLQAALTPPPGKADRQFDALIMSAGGNDLHFGEIGLRCMFDDMCWPDSMIWENPTRAYNLSQFLPLELTRHADGGLYYSLPDNFESLAGRISDLRVQPDNVYITQYADQTRSNNYGEAVSNFCTVVDDIFWPINPWGWMVIPAEAEKLTHVALHDLNHTIQSAADLYGWQYIDGITSYEVDPDPTKEVGSPGPFVKDANGKGHGYCASDNWIIRAAESELTQGPWPFGRTKTAGTLHPNTKGIQVIKNRLLYYMLPDLEATLPGNPPGDPPTFISSFTSGDLTSQPGVNGWFTQSCDSNGNCLPQVVLQVTATGSVPLEAANVQLNDQAGCSIPGVTCPTTIITPTNQLRWDFTFLTDGFYRMQFSARDSNDQIADYNFEIKVDLHDPVFSAIGPYEVDEGDSITLTAQAGDANGAMLNFDWDLDQDGNFETTDEQPVFSAAALDGPYSKTVDVLVTDEAGRSATATTTIDVLNVAPTVVINGAPETSPEGTVIALTSLVTDVAADTSFTYAWSVEKDGGSYTSGADATFSFTPEDNGVYDVSLKVTDKDGGEGSASQTIDVTNIAPALSNVQYNPATVNEGGSVTVSGSVIDPGTKDSLSLAINWGDGSAEDTQNLAAGTTSFTASHTYSDDKPSGTASDSNTITVMVTDKDEGSDTKISAITVNNLPPDVTLTEPADGMLYRINDLVNVAATVTDPGTSDTLSCSVNWGDGSTSAGTLVAGACSASHTFTAAGVYALQLTATDDDTGSDTKSVMVVVYDPSAGFVIGGGWISSPAGAYKADESLSGKATFGFVSKYQKGASVPTGNTAFQFQVGGFEFYSTAYDWLVVNSAGTNAQFKGAGRVNGMLDPNGNAYKFMLWAGDGSIDTFRIRIWWEDAAGEHDMYDNGVAQAIGGGSIVVHTK